MTNTVIFRWPGLCESPFIPKMSISSQTGAPHTDCSKQPVPAPCKFPVKVPGSDRAQCWRGMCPRRKSSASSSACSCSESPGTARRTPSMELCHDLLPNQGPGPSAAPARGAPRGSARGQSRAEQPVLFPFTAGSLAGCGESQTAEMESTEMLTDKGWGYPGETFHLCAMGRRFWRLISHKNQGTDTTGSVCPAGYGSVGR